VRTALLILALAALCGGGPRYDQWQRIRDSLRYKCDSLSCVIMPLVDRQNALQGELDTWEIMNPDSARNK
jgi:hypothetical protein